MVGAKPLDESDAMKQLVWSKVKEEIRSTEKNETWRLVDLPAKK